MPGCPGVVPVHMSQKSRSVCRQTRLLMGLAILVLGVALACAAAAPEAMPAPAVTDVPPMAVPTFTAVPDTPTAPPPAPTLIPTGAPVSPTPKGESLIQLEDPLDEPEFYCVDVVGFRDSLKLDRALQAHTCKPGAEDELFSFNQPSSGQIYMAAYDLCVEAGEGRLYLKPYSQGARQRFTHEAGGSIRPEGTDLCLAVEEGSGQQAGGRRHIRRDLLLAPCAGAEPGRSRWLLPGRRP